MAVPYKKKLHFTQSRISCGVFQFPPVFTLASASLPPLSLPQVSPVLGLSCVFKVIAYGSQGVCIRACHKQSIGMSRSLVHEPNPVKSQTKANGWMRGVKELFNYNLNVKKKFKKRNQVREVSNPFNVTQKLS